MRSCKSGGRYSSRRRASALTPCPSCSTQFKEKEAQLCPRVPQAFRKTRHSITLPPVYPSGDKPGVRPAQMTKRPAECTYPPQRTRASCNIFFTNARDVNPRPATAAAASTPALPVATAPSVEPSSRTASQESSQLREAASEPPYVSNEAPEPAPVVATPLPLPPPPPQAPASPPPPAEVALVPSTAPAGVTRPVVRDGLAVDVDTVVRDYASLAAGRLRCSLLTAEVESLQRRKEELRSMVDARAGVAGAVASRCTPQSYESVPIVHDTRQEVARAVNTLECDMRRLMSVVHARCLLLENRVLHVFTQLRTHVDRIAAKQSVLPGDSGCLFGCLPLVESSRRVASLAHDLRSQRAALLRSKTAAHHVYCKRCDAVSARFAGAA